MHDDNLLKNEFPLKSVLDPKRNREKHQNYSKGSSTIKLAEDLQLHHHIHHP
jgi:hypothetical protein